MAVPQHAIRIAYTRSQDLIQHSPQARRQRWTTVTQDARDVERLGKVVGWLPYNSLYRVVGGDDIQGYYLVEEA